jgi:hypothetical protein
MNRVGGKLRRHSKANANAVVKTQKQYFAKARLAAQSGIAAPSPPAFSVLDGHFNHREPENNIGSCRNTGLIPEKAQSPDHLPSLHIKPHKRKRKNPSSPPHRGKTSQDSPISVTTTTAKHITKRQRRSGANTIEDVKLDLLSRSDWMGLGVTRPVRVRLMSSAEMDKIGRRRKITSEDRKRRDKARKRDHIRHDLIKPFEVVQDGDLHSTVDVEDCIRVGFNIHQTQTSQKASWLPHGESGSVSSEFILCDKLDEEHDTATNDSMNFSRLQKDFNGLGLGENFDSSLREDGGMINVLPLKQVLDLDSFDKVKERSSSIAQHLSFLTSQHVPGESETRRTAQQSLLSKQSQSGSPTGSHKEIGASESDPQRHMTPKSPNRRWTAVHVHDRANPPAPSYGAFGVLPGVGMEALPTKTSKQLVAPERELTQERAPPVLATTELSASPQIEEMEVHAFSRPLFTLEYQAALEADMFGDRYLVPNGEHSLEIASIQSRPHHVSPPIQQQGFFSKDLCMERLTLHRPQFRMPMPRLITQDSQFFNPASNAELGVQRDQQNYSHASGSQYNPPDFNSAQKPFQIDSEFLIAQQELEMSTTQPLPPPLVERLDAADTVCDENEARRKFVFAKDFENVQRGFKFAPSKAHHIQAQIHRQPPLEDRTSPGESSLLDGLSLNDASRNILSPVKTIQTSANTILYQARRPLSPQAFTATSPSDTDFLSQISPMEGYLDERLADISLYNNPSRTERSFDEAHMWPGTC